MNDHKSKVGDKVVRYCSRAENPCMVITGHVTELLNRPNQLGLHWLNVKWETGKTYAFPEEHLEVCGK